jgi:tRNA wybutosine-synthesizing protein 3
MFRRMLEDVEVGYLDPDIYNLLLLLFSRQESFPVSSCSGRITLVDAPMPWHRRGSTVIFKKHATVEKTEIESILSQPPLSRFWLVVTGPILHISALTLREASTLLKIARRAGMKHSGVLSISKRGIYLELKTGVRLTILLKSGSYEHEHLAEVVRVANEALAEGKSRLKRLYEELSRAST